MSVLEGNFGNYSQWLARPIPCLDTLVGAGNRSGVVPDFIVYILHYLVSIHAPVRGGDSANVVPEAVPRWNYHYSSPLFCLFNNQAAGQPPRFRLPGSSHAIARHEQASRYHATTPFSVFPSPPEIAKTGSRCYTQ